MSEIIYQQLVSNTFNSILGNLLSGFLGAYFLYCFQKQREQKSNKAETLNLCWVLLSELRVILAYIKPKDKLVSQVGNVLISKSVCRSLAPEMIRLLPPRIVRNITHAYNLLEIQKNLEINVEVLLKIVEDSYNQLLTFVHKIDRNYKRSKKKSDLTKKRTLLK